MIEKRRLPCHERVFSGPTGPFADPVQRTTLECDFVDRDWQAAVDAEYWSCRTLVQAERNYRTILSELSMGARRYSLQRLLVATPSFEGHCFLFAAGNLEKAVLQLKKSFSDYAPSARTRRVLKLLRDIFEQ